MGNIINLSTAILWRRPSGSSSYSANVVNLHDRLIDVIDIDVNCGLLAELYSSHVLTKQQHDEITSRGRESVSYLLKLFVKMTHEKQVQFLDALNKTNQKHVSNYIMANGHRPAFTDDWPLVHHQMEIMKWDRNRYNFNNLLMTKTGLLDRLFSMRCINELQKNRLENNNSDADSNEQLFTIFRRKSVGDYKKFVKCLKETKQHRLVSLLAVHPDAECNERPISTEHVTMLEQQRAVLIDIIDLKTSSLMAQLRALDSITSRQWEYIESVTENSRRVDRLLQIMSRGSEKDFTNFMYCLHRAGQGHVCSCLAGDGAVTVVEAKIELTEISTPSETENQLVMRINDILRSENARRLLGDKLFQLISSGEYELIWAKTGNSIELFYFCKSLSALHQLRDEYCSGKLRKAIGEFFAHLRDEADGCCLSVDSLEWHMPSYLSCAERLSALSNLPIFSELYRQAQESSNITTDSDIGAEESTIKQLLPELMELIILKSTGQLFEVVNAMTPAAHVYTIATLKAVSQQWCQLLSKRPYYRRLLKRYSRRSCHPFSCYPPQLIKICAYNDVYGIAELRSRLYVISYRSNVIQVFNSSSPFTRFDEISVDGLMRPNSLAADDGPNKYILYIADIQTCVIFRVHVKYRKSDVFIPAADWQPWSISVNSSRLLVTPRDGCELFIYNDNGELMTSVKLSSNMVALHALETVRSSFIVSHGCDRDEAFRVISISEVDCDGKVIRSLNNPHKDISTVQFRKPPYLINDGNGHIIAADRAGKRIILLGPELQLKRVLVTSLDGEPTRLWFSKANGLLFVSYAQSSNIGVYRLIRKPVKAVSVK